MDFFVLRISGGTRVTTITTPSGRTTAGQSGRTGRSNGRRRTREEWAGGPSSTTSTATRRSGWAGRCHNSSNNSNSPPSHNSNSPTINRTRGCGWTLRRPTRPQRPAVASLNTGTDCHCQIPTYLLLLL